MARHPSIVIWYCTTRCAYLCKHCCRYEMRSLKEVDTKTAKRIIKSIAEANPKVLAFSGGEPLLRKDIAYLIKYARDLGLKLAIDIRSAELTDEMASLLSREEVHACISLDAISPSITDDICGFKGAHERIMRTIRKCKEFGIPFGIDSAVLKSNAEEIPKLTELTEELGGSTHHVSIVVPLGKALKNWDSIVPTSSQILYLYRKMYEQQKKRRIDVTFYEPTYARFLKEQGEEPPEWLKCKIGKRLHIDVDGSVIPCSRAWTPTVGNVLEKPLNEIYEEVSNSEFFKRLRNPKELEGACSSCEYGDVCGGGCRVRAYMLTGNWFTQDPLCPYATMKARNIHKD